MEIYLDTADLDEIREAVALGVISGVTTNPTLMMRAGRCDYREVAQEICSLVQGPVSAEVISSDAEGMIAEARSLARWSPYVVVKIPATLEGLRAIRALNREEIDLDGLCEGCDWVDRCDTGPEGARELAEEWGIRTNATLVFSCNQALMVARAGAAFASPFVGRLDDAGHRGMDVVEEAVEIFESYGIETQIIAASLRHPAHIREAALAGADIATIPYKVLVQAMRHPLTDAGVEKFLRDWNQVRGSGS